MNNLITVTRDITPTSKQALSPELLHRFIAYLDASPKTVETYGKALRQFMFYAQRNGINYPQREDIIAYRDDLKASGYKPTTIQNYLTAVKLFFRWTAQEGLYANIAEHIKGARLDRAHKKDYLTGSQVKAVMKTIDRNSLQGQRDFAIFALMVTGGLRTIEVSRANIEDLRTVGEHTALFIQGKGRDEKTEYVKIPADVEQAIRAYLKARGEANEKAPLFASMSNNSMGKSLSTRSISGIVKTRLQEAGFNSERLTAHSLRHTAVTLSLLAGKDLPEVQQFARHANIATTMIYNHSLDQAKNSCSDAIAQTIF